MSEGFYPTRITSGNIVGLKVHDEQGAYYVIGHLAEGKGSSEWRAVSGPFASQAAATENLNVLNASLREMDNMQRGGNWSDE